MCIRDRLDVALDLGTHAADRDGLGDVEADAAHGVDQRLEAVSYTHLRAHETVLDIVCRLLLDTNT